MPIGDLFPIQDVYLVLCPQCGTKTVEGGFLVLRLEKQPEREMLECRGCQGIFEHDRENQKLIRFEGLEQETHWH